MKKLLSIAFVLSAVFLTDAKADCTRHIYNKSIMAWDVKPVFSTGGALITPSTCVTTSPQGWSTLQPGCVAEITYISQNRAIPTGTIGRLYFRGGVIANYSYFEGVFESCGRINHSGSTDGMNLNDPADGDVTLFGQSVQ